MKQRLIEPGAAPPTMIPIPLLTERLGSLNKVGNRTGRFWYLPWTNDDHFLGLHAGDVLKIAAGTRPQGIPGEIVFVEIFNNHLHTIRMLEASSDTMISVWATPERCEQASTTYCRLHKLVGRLELEPSQRAFIMRSLSLNGIGLERQKQREVLKLRPSSTKENVPTEPSALAWLFSRSKLGRVLYLKGSTRAAATKKGR